jgi:YggT family protein
MLNLNPFINLISSILSIYQFLLILYIVFYYLFMFKVVNPYNQFIIQINRFLIKIIEPVLNKIRHYIPSFSGIDLSILILFLAIHFTQDILYSYLYV